MGGVDVVAGQLQQHREAVCRVPVVVHDQNATWDALTRVGRQRARAAGPARPGQQRQTHNELTALTDTRAAGFDCAAVHFHQILDQGQTEPQPAARALQRRIDLREHLEDSAKLVGGDADARVPDSDDRLLAFLLDREPDATALVGELAGVVQEVAHHLSQPDRVAVDVHGIRRQRDGQFMTQALTVRAGGFDGMVHDRDQLRSLFAKLDLALADAAHVEKVVDLPDHVPHLSVQDFGRRSDGPSVAVRPQQDLDGVADRGQRVAEFVGQHRQEFVLAAIGLAQRLVRTDHAARRLGVVQHAVGERFVRLQEQADVLLEASGRHGFWSSSARCAQSPERP